VVLGAGALLASWPWFAGVAGATSLGWLLVAWHAQPAPGWTHSGFALLSAVVLGALLQHSRLDGIRRRAGAVEERDRAAAALRDRLGPRRYPRLPRGAHPGGRGRSGEPRAVVVRGRHRSRAEPASAATGARELPAAVRAEPGTHARVRPRDAGAARGQRGVA